jgi:hypothetical protein
MAADVNDITIQYEEDGVVLVKEIDKEILSKGLWTTILLKRIRRRQLCHPQVPEGPRRLPAEIQIRYLQQQAGKNDRRDPGEMAEGLVCHPAG